eukprot:scaffold19822_cov57-Cylindrotheca_fusiformis.AAC.1
MSTTRIALKYQMWTNPGRNDHKSVCRYPDDRKYNIRRHKRQRNMQTRQASSSPRLPLQERTCETRGTTTRNKNKKRAMQAQRSRSRRRTRRLRERMARTRRRLQYHQQH